MLDLTSHTAVPTTFILNEEGKLMASLSTTTKVTLVPSCIPPPSASLKVDDSAEEVLRKLMDLGVLWDSSYIGALCALWAMTTLLPEDDEDL